MTVFTYGIVNAKISILNVMEKESWEEKDVELVAMHQSNQMIIKNVRMSLKSTPEKFPTNMKEYGNTGQFLCCCVIYMVTNRCPNPLVPYFVRLV